MPNEIRQFADELLSKETDSDRQMVIESWEASKNVISKTPISSPPYLTYLDDAVSINVPGFPQGEIVFDDANFSLDLLKAYAAAFTEAYWYALDTQPARDEEKELKDAVIAAGTDVPLDEESANNLVTELDRLGYEIVKKV